MIPSQHPALRRALAVLWALGFLTSAALADEGKTALHFSGPDKGFLFAGLAIGLLSIGVGLWLCNQLLMVPAGSDKMQEVGQAIREGALAYLGRQVRTMLGFVVLLAVGLLLLFSGPYGWATSTEIAICFCFGVTCSYTAGYSGMLMAVNGNMRTANAALTSYKKALEVAFRSGSVTGLMTVGIGLTGATAIFLLGGADAMKLLVGFGFGSSLAALFMRVGGGIFTKAADVGADLVGKVEAGIPEDDPRNPATIADNVGDNVGDCAGMAADVFESYTVTLVAAIILGAATAAIFDEKTWMRLVIFALTICGLGILSSIFGIFAVRGSDNIDDDPLKRIRGGFITAAVLVVLGVGCATFAFLGGAKDPIQTTTLVSTEQVHRDKVLQLVHAREAEAKKEGKKVWEIDQDALAKSDAAKALKMEDKVLLGLAPEAVGYRAEEAPALPDLSGYHPIDFNSKSEAALDYVVPNPMWDPTAGVSNRKGHFTTLGDAYGVGGDKARRQAELGVFKVKLTVDKPDPRTGKVPDPQELTIGPFSRDQLDFRVNITNRQNALSGLGRVSLEYEATYPVRLYANSRTGQIAFAIDGDVDADSIMRSSLAYFRAPLSEVTDAESKADASNQQKMPDQYQTIMAVVRHQKVPWFLFALPVLIGVLLAFGIEQLTDYYVSTKKRPTQEVAGVATAGAAPLIIQGFSYALESSVFMVVAIVLALVSQLWIFPPAAYGGSYLLSFFGIALVGLGLLSTTGFILAMDTFGPISDNAQGVFEMSGANDEYGSKAVARLDAAGNTTKALTKGFAIATAVIAAVALFHSFLEDAQLAQIGLRLDLPEIFLGFMIGGAAPYLFSAFSINAVGRAAFQLINEVRRQFHSDPGIMAGTSKPNYAACVSIVTAAAQRELLAPGILAISLPILVGFGFAIGKPLTVIGTHSYNLGGVQALGGFLAGAILSGQLMAVLLANSGGIWDNAKKLIEDGLYGGKGSEAHKASVVGDTVGDPFKDTAGPALNPLIKVMNLVSLLLAPTFILPMPEWARILIAGLALSALATSMILAKRGSMSSEFKHAVEDPV